jgi:hypothetical protein
MPELMTKNIMKRNAIKLILISFISLLSSCDIVLAKDFSFNVGVSAIYANINDPKYDFADKYETVKNPLKSIKSINTGITKSFDNLNITIQTNRLINSALTRNVVDKNTRIALQNKSKITNDTLLVGYRFGRFVPAVLVSNTKLEKSLYYKGNFQGKQTNHAILYGLNFGYLLSRNTNASLIYIAPNKELNLESAIGLGFNYLF